MDRIQQADRSSLLKEARFLRAQLNNRTDPKRELEMEPKCQGNLCGCGFALHALRTYRFVQVYVSICVAFRSWLHFEDPSY